MSDLIFQNYHKHTYWSNIKVADSATSIEDYCKRAVELGHGIISSVEHGWQGHYIECHQLAEKYGLKFVFGTEAYWVKDRLALDENGHKDGKNCHICLLAMNENGRQAINDILSQAAIDGYYRQSRIDLDLILSLPADDVVVTSACIAGWGYEDADSIFLRMKEHFGNNFYLEVQYHNTEPQKRLNKHILKLKKQYGFQIIMGCDSHYIDEKGALDRDEFIKSKGMCYPDEEGWYMDYPDGQTAYNRFVEQCVLSHNEIMEAMDNTNVFLNVEEYDCPIFNHDIKMPTLYPELTQEQRDDILENLIWDQWDEYKVEVPEERWAEYEEQIKYELDIVKTTFHSDYFLLDHAITKLGKEKGGQLTLTGRGSGVSFFLNKLLGFTSVDRISAQVKMYPERFMSPTRILETHSLADIDMNVAVQEPFWEAQEELLGYEHSKQMIAYQQLKPSAAWKMYAKAKNIDFETANKVSDQIKKYIKAVGQAGEDEKDDIDVLDYIDEEYKEIYLKSTDYLGVISSVSPHPCFDGEELVNTIDGFVPIKDICIGDIVLTKENEYKTVTNTFVTENSPIGVIDIQGRPKIKVTPNHPFLCKHMKRGKGNYREFSEEEWVNAENLITNDFVCVGTINDKSIIPIYEDVPTDNENFWWIVGRFIGDGWLKKLYPNRSGEYITTICCAFDELSDITNVLDKLGTYKYWIEKTRTTYKIFISNKNLYYFLLQFDKGASNKFIPNHIIDMPKKLVESMIDGYVSADGHIRPDAIYVTTVSKKLALTFASCISKVYGTYAGVREVQRKDSFLEGRILKGNTQYLIRFRKERKSKDNYMIDEQNKIWVRFHNYTLLDEVQTVYNFEVEDSHTYCVNDVIVHNCASLVYEGNIRKEIGYIYVKSASNEGRICCCMDGKWAEKYGFLKNDWLKVNVVEVIYKIFERIGIEPFSSTDLIKKCENDADTWSLYKKQCTDGLNQVEQPASSTKVGTYAPTNISELTAFVAAVRPGFKSMYDIFESREHFDYNIPTFDKLLQTKEMPNSFVLYQEQAMLTLNYAGIPMSECYAVIKAISKKRVDEITKNKPIFIEGFTKKIQEDEGLDAEKAEKIAHKVWKIIEDSSAYSFNSAHAYSVALDSLYEAWLKAHYPLEFYETYLNILNEKGDKDRLNKFKDEAEHYFNILFPPYRFRQDNRAITIDKENNSINNALSSIKGYSNLVADALYECGNNTTTFIEALKYLDERSIKSAKILPLVLIGYFSEFGNENALATFIGYWDILKQGEARSISKEKADAILTNIIQNYATGTNKDGSSSKSWKIVHMNGLLEEIYNYCINNVEPPTYKQKMGWQKDILGYIELTTNKKEDIKKIFILDVKPLIGQYSPDPWCYKVETRSIGTGRTASLNVKADDWNYYGELKPNDIINVGKVQKNKKGYWYLYEYEKEE